MASFFENLWESVFVAGPTPTLIVATNVAFACLQLLFFALLLATYSVHFAILSFLSAGLWWAINWFVVELEEAKRKEAAAGRPWGQSTTGGGVDLKHGSDADDDTETEAETVVGTKGTGSHEVETLAPTGRLNKRRSEVSNSGGEMSTEDEWEKVEDEDEKDK
jgi:ER protein Pkr1